ncbi:MAG: hypothetical protein ACT4QD_13840 [Acidobacteriota bacterium]
MHFAIALPWWGYVAALLFVAVCAWLAYRGAASGASPSICRLLIALRAITLTLVVAFLLRPVKLVPSERASDDVVAILLDVSRSMRLADEDGPTRLEQARVLAAELQARTGPDFKVDLLTFGESVERADLTRISADARRSDLTGALRSLIDRYRGQQVAGVVVISDGGDTSLSEGQAQRTLDAPVFSIGVGRPSIARDREVLQITAGRALLVGSSVDLGVAVASTGFGTTPVSLRLTENGRPIETRQITPPPDGAPMHVVFTVSPSQERVTVYGVEIPAAAGELTPDNNVRRVLVPPQERRRRVLMLEGAPGFEHTFLKRALARDAALEVDSLVRKGQNDEGRDTFFIQAAASRSAALANGYPVARRDLFVYDALVLANVGGEFFSRDQLAMTASFVATRGGGLLFLGSRSLASAGLIKTALEPVLPIDVTDRRVWRDAQGGPAQPPPALRVALTADGAAHPATRVAATSAEARARWSQLPSLAAVAAAGAPRPGAQVLAVAGDGAGGLRPLVVTQRYGLGRSMVFTGEGSWRWRMLLPASDTTYELVWRHVARWLASEAAEKIEMAQPTVGIAGTTDLVSVFVRDDEFAPVGDAEVVLRVSGPDGRERTVSAALADPRDGRYAAAVRFDLDGAYSLVADVRRASQTFGRAVRPVLVGAADLEMSDPRLNEAALQRIAEATGGRYFSASEALEVPGLLKDAAAASVPMEMRDLWHNGWSLTAIVLLLGAEWLVRRRVGLA